MTRQNNIYAPQQKLLHIIHRAHSGFLSHATKTFHRKNDDGGMLIEVLVALLILAIVFTSTTLALSDLAAKRVAVEQRDRAVKIITTLEEESRVFRCGLNVDKVDSPSPTTTDFDDYVNVCDFEANNSGGSVSPINGGDQSFTFSEDLGNGSFQEFEIDIRYWWEVGGTDVHEDQCLDISSYGATQPTGGILPSILVRAFRIEWEEKGATFDEVLVKKDPVAVDSAVFATGSRSSILRSVASGDSVELSVNPGANRPHIRRIVDDIFVDRGQPQRCVWFPYIEPDSTDQRYINGSGVSPSEGAGGFTS